MPIDLNALESCLEELDSLFPYRYGQWLIEDPVTLDYRVVAERISVGTQGYSIAHRTGVIGQVFRTGHAIVVPNTGAHPLYDLFDTVVDWELAIPVWQGQNMACVLNLEGSGVLELQTNSWHALGEFVSAMGMRIDDTQPDPQALGLVNTRRATRTVSLGQADDVFKIALRLARRGKTVLLISASPEGTDTINRTACYAETNGVPLAECIRGVAPRLDMLSLGTADGGMRAFEGLSGWDLVNGRYEFVLVKIDRQ